MSILLIPGQHIHIVGIGGFGMSAVARILLDSGYKITGSDRQTNPLTAALAADGVTIFQDHTEEQIEGAELILASSAVDSSNPEIQAARQNKIPVMYRRDFMDYLMEGYQVIAVAGTHGKTTTTAMLAHVLVEAGLDPSFIVGGVMKNYNTNAGAGLGEHFVIEADEYDHMFLGLHPAIAIVNNVEYDHPDFFPSPEDVLRAFQDFVNLVEPDGLLVLNADNDITRTFAEARRAELHPVQTFAIDNNTADWWAIDLKPNTLGGVDFVACQGALTGGVIGPVHLTIPGRHNVQNALAVIAVARHLGVSFDVITSALLSFKGTERRSDLMGEAAGVKVISDYAHHPTAINLTLKTWREQPDVRHLWAVWQPHTYSRTRTLAETFKESFKAADHALVTDIYAAREEFTPGLDAQDVVELIRRTGHPDARHSGDIFETAQILANEVQAGDVVMILSAGDAPRVGQALLDVLARR